MVSIADDESERPILNYATRSRRSPFSRWGIASFCLLFSIFPAILLSVPLGVFVLHLRPETISLVVNSKIITLGGGAIVLGAYSLKLSGIALRNIFGVIGFLVPATGLVLAVIDYLLHRS